MLLTMTSALEVASEETKIEKSSKSTKKYPDFQVVLDDEIVDLFLVHNPYAKVTGGGTKAVIDQNGRRHLAYFDSDATLDPKKKMFFKPNLLGASLEYDTDLSRANCGCDATL